MITYPILINYLRGTNIEVGLLLNFGKKPEFIRKVYENKRKILAGREKGWNADDADASNTDQHG
jgi:hypothetical protein